MSTKRRARTRLLAPVFLATLAACAALARADAQTVNGRVIVGGTDRGLAGALVSAVDSAGREFGKTLTDATGQFRVSVMAGRYRIRAEGVGVRTALTPVLDLQPGAELTQQIVVEPSAHLLRAVRVVERTRCVATPAGAQATAAIWEEIRKALTNTSVVVEQARFRATFVTFERELDPRTRALRRSRTSQRSGWTENPYVSLAAESLVTRGFARLARDGAWYYAPDAATLLSDAFSRTHCYRAQPGTGNRRGMIGLAFEPATRRGVVDVSGVMWLDLRTSELVSLEYEYVGLPEHLAGHGLGGEVEFDRTPAGLWIVRRWAIRMPKLERVIRYRTSPVLEMGIPPRLTPTSADVITAIVEHGGEIAGLNDVAEVNPVRGSIRGTVMDSTTTKALPNATVVLAYADSSIAAQTATDSSGRFEFRDIDQGQYIVAFVHPRADSLGTPGAFPHVKVGAGETQFVDLWLPSVVALARAACPRLADSESRLRGMFRGSPSGAEIIVRWQSDFKQSRQTLSAREHTVRVTPDSRGWFEVCGVPRSGPISVHVSGDVGAPVIVDADNNPSVFVGLTPQRAAASSTSGASRGRISGTVRTKAGAPLGGAVVLVHQSEGEVRTSDDGRFSIQGLPAGRHVIEARAIGYVPTRRNVIVSDGAVDTLTLTLGDRIQILESTRIAADPDVYRTGFDVRARRSAGGHFLTRQTIRASAVRRVTELLDKVPGLQVQQVGQAAVVEFAGRGQRAVIGGCPVMFFLNGVPYVPGSQGIDGEMQPDDLERVEVYDAATAPTQFSRLGAACGIVLLWTREWAVEREAQERAKEGGVRVKER